CVVRQPNWQRFKIATKRSLPRYRRAIRQSSMRFPINASLDQCSFTPYPRPYHRALFLAVIHILSTSKVMKNEKFTGADDGLVASVTVPSSPTLLLVGTERLPEA